MGHEIVMEEAASSSRNIGGIIELAVTRSIWHGATHVVSITITYEVSEHRLPAAAKSRG